VGSNGNGDVDMMKLGDCYHMLKSIPGEATEPYEPVTLVERYRRYWQPDNIRVILLAESNVFTTDSDRRVELPKIDSLPGYPTEYAKFVYCLAYREKNLTGDRLHPRRDGTPQFRKVFYSRDTRVTSKWDFKPILSQTPYEERLRNKSELLLSLKHRGAFRTTRSYTGDICYGKDYRL
jgi:hypothetical protein